MKKILFFAFVAGMFCSCKKDYTCTCTCSGSYCGTYYIKHTTKKKAAAECQAHAAGVFSETFCTMN